MKIAFIGANGHHMLRGLLPDAQAHGITSIAMAGDGMDDQKVKDNFEVLKFTGEKKFFESHTDMLDDYQPDMVNIGVRYGHNGRFIAQTLARDIPTCSDKPVAASWEQLEQIKQLTKDTEGQPAHPKRILVSEFPLRCKPAFVAARNVIAQGVIGEVVLATAQKSYRFATRPDWYANRQDYGSTILWVASHAIDYLHFVTGLRYTSVNGIMNNVSRKKKYGSMEEYTINTFTLENGAGAMVHADFNRPASAPTHGDDRLRIVGSKGQIEIRDERCELITNDQPPADIADQVTPANASVEMFRALQGQPSQFYGTQASLDMAAVLLIARDATDQHVTLPIQM